MKKLSNTEAELKKSLAYKKGACSLLIPLNLLGSSSQSSAAFIKGVLIKSS